MYSTSNINDKVEIRMENDGMASIEPIKIPDFFNKQVNKYSNHPALVYYDNTENWKTITYSEYNNKVRQTAKAFIKLGLEPRESVAIISFNCAEWFYSEFAVIFAGGICTGIYTTNSAEAVRYVLESSNSTIIVVDDSKQLQKIHSIKSKLINLKAVIQINGPFGEIIETEENYYKWSDIENLDTSEYETELEKRINKTVVNECCTLIYTSGTTGTPKGVMLSHDNLTFPVNNVGERFYDIKYGEEVFVSYLPLNHIAAQALDVFIPMGFGGCVYIADRNALKGTIIKTITKARPTRFIGVPRVYEKFHEQLIGKQIELNSVARFILKAAQASVTNYHLNRMAGKRSYPFTYELGKQITNKLKTGLGFDKCKTILTGAAPVSIETKKFFMGIDMELCDVYGLSEIVGVSLNRSQIPNFDTVGKPMAGSLVKIKNPDANGLGEIYVKSRNVFMGYINDVENTKESFDNDGYFATGDIGYVDDNEYLYINGRLKEIVMTAGGENVPPVHVENIVKKELPLISNAILIGDKRKYLTILLTFKTEINNETGCPTDDLEKESVEWMENLNLKYKTVTEILNAGPCPIVLDAIQDGINRYNSIAISNAQKIQKFKILEKDFSLVTGELGPTLKLKRLFVIEKYAEIINEMYK